MINAETLKYFVGYHPGMGIPILDDLVGMLGRLLVGSEYRMPEDQRSGVFRAIEDWQRSRQHQLLERHRAECLRRGLNLEFYLLDVSDGMVKIEYQIPAKSVFVMYGLPVEEEPSTALQRYDERRVPLGTSLAYHDFSVSSEELQNEACYRMLRPFSLLPGEGDRRAYHQVLLDIFNSGYEIPLLKGIAIADDITRFLQQTQERALPGRAVRGTGGKYSSLFQIYFEEIFEMHLHNLNDRYTSGTVLTDDLEVGTEEEVSALILR